MSHLMGNLNNSNKITPVIYFYKSCFNFLQLFFKPTQWLIISNNQMTDFVGSFTQLLNFVTCFYTS